MDSSIVGGTKNYAHSVGRRLADAQLRAAGWQRGTGLESGSKKRFNGGITRHLTKRLQAGDKLFRFAPSGPFDAARHVSGEWWFDQNAAIFLLSKSDGTDDGFRQAARWAFCVLPEWGDMGNCMSVHLAADYWAIAGTAARANGESGTMTNPFGTDCLTLFIPGGLVLADLTLVRPVGLTRLKY
jgi:hypothetical protein